MTINSLLADPAYKNKVILKKIISHYTGFSQEEMRLHMDEVLTHDSVSQIQTAYQTYERDRKPIEYITGVVQFFGIDFMVNEHTLIPRAETEYMVQAVTEYCATLQNSHQTPSAIGHHPLTHILRDIGTGCGVLGISVLLQNPTLFTQAYLTDYSLQALQVAKQNAHLLQNNTTPTSFIQADLLDFVPQYSRQNAHITLVANLPYIPEESFEQGVGEDVKNREPKMAFVGGDDGLDWYRKMFDQLINFDSQKLLGPYTMFLEMMTRQVDILRQEYGHYFNFTEVKTFHFNIRIVQTIRI